MKVPFVRVVLLVFLDIAITLYCGGNFYFMAIVLHDHKEGHSRNFGSFFLHPLQTLFLRAQPLPASPVGGGGGAMTTCGIFLMSSMVASSASSGSGIARAGAGKQNHGEKTQIERDRHASSSNHCSSSVVAKLQGEGCLARSDLCRFVSS